MFIIFLKWWFLFLEEKRRDIQQQIWTDKKRTATKFKNRKDGQTTVESDRKENTKAARKPAGNIKREY